MKNFNKGWTTEQLINLSQSWAYVFPTDTNQAKADRDAWTTEQFIRVGNKHIYL
ncbi:hypothetical protein ABN584_09400 [Gloeocapsa sp. BRSZ]